MPCSKIAFWKCQKLFTLSKQYLINILLGKEEKTMMAMLWAQKIMLGKKKFSQVPALLKNQVKEILAESGCEELATENAE